MSAKAQIHGVMAKNGILPVVAEMWGPAGDARLDHLQLPPAYQVRMESLRGLIARYDAETAVLDRRIHHELKDDAGYKAILHLPGVGKVALRISAGSDGGEQVPVGLAGVEQ